MPSVILNKETVLKLVGKKIPDDKLKERISMLGTDLDSIEGNEIDVEIFPNRPDLLSEQGFARALGSFMGFKKGLRKYEVKKGGKDYRVIIDKSVEKVRPFTACAIVKNLKFDDEKIREIIQIQEKLHVTYGRNRKKCAIGVYPLEKIKLPIHYVAKKPKDVKFVPLEMNKEMDGLQILSRHPAGRDYAHLLEGLSKFPFFMDGSGSVLSMPPIINSHHTGKISEDTKEVFIEFSGFDYDVVSTGLNMVVTALADMGGEIYEMKLEYGKKKLNSPNLKPWELKFDSDYINNLLGLKLSKKEMQDCLEKMGYGCKGNVALVPAYRADVLHQVDLAEDIAIAYGYENVDCIIPNVATVAEEDHFEIFKNRIATILAGASLLETKTYNLTNKDVQTKMMGVEIENVEIANALNLEYNVLRSWVTPCLMKVLNDNRQHEYPQRIFTIGRIFKKDGLTETGTSEADRLGVALCDAETDFTKIRQILDLLMDALNLEYDVEETEHDSFVPGRVGRVLVNGKKVAYIGEMHPQVLENFELEMPVSVLELNLSDLFDSFSL